MMERGLEGEVFELGGVRVLILGETASDGEDDFRRGGCGGSDVVLGPDFPRLRSHAKFSKRDALPVIGLCLTVPMPMRIDKFHGTPLSSREVRRLFTAADIPFEHWS